MNRKFLAILALILTVTLALPMTVQAASNASKLNAITKLSQAAKYDAALPKKGAKKSTEKKVAALRKKIKYKVPGKGPTTYAYSLTFTKSDPKGKINSAEKTKEWYEYNSKNSTRKSYEESIDLYDFANTPSTRCFIRKQDKKIYEYWSWTKGATNGYYSKNNIGGGGSSSWKDSNYTVYPDAKVLGQKCFVYSYDSKSGSTKYTYYNYVSRKTGGTIKRVSVSGNYIRTTITFDCKLMKAVNFYTPPANVTFNTDSIRSDNITRQFELLQDMAS